MFRLIICLTCDVTFSAMKFLAILLSFRKRFYSYQKEQASHSQIHLYFCNNVDIRLMRIIY